MSRLFSVALPLVVGLLLPVAAARAMVVEMTTPLGSFRIQMLDAVAPNTVANFLQYVNSGLYQDVLIHRAAGIDDGAGGLIPFVLQGGGYIAPPDGEVQVGAVPILHDQPWNNPVLKNEFTGTKNVRGTIAMALAGSDINSGTNQWFINLNDNSALLDPQKFTVFATVIGNGMDVVDALSNLQTYGFGQPFNELPLLPSYTEEEYFSQTDFLPKSEDWVTFSARVVPEPASVAMALCGMALVGGAAWQRKRRRRLA
jgi:peptidyl-prolyl cis-trans isomerase A (cyclophilin A)